MSDVSARFAKVAGRFTATASAVPHGAWANPSPCDGWDARDIVRHLVEWVPPFLHAGAGVALAGDISVDEDPVAAWTALSGSLQALLDDPVASLGAFSHERAGNHTLEGAIALFILGDVLVHTWDLARAAGLDDTLDPDEVHLMLAGIEPLGDVLAQSGHYAARVGVPDGADEQTRLIAYTGRRPARPSGWGVRAEGALAPPPAN